MKKSLCHYSYHRRIKEEEWNLERFVIEAEKLEIEGIDFHVAYLPEYKEAVKQINALMSKTTLELSGLSMSNSFNKEEDEFNDQVEKVKRWLDVAGDVGAPVSRIFGGSISDRSNTEELKKALDKVIKGIELVLPSAEKNNVILALENHGGLPCTGEEQVEVIKKMNSPFLKATIDVGNYMQCGQTGDEGTKIAAPYCKYVHFKDFKKDPTHKRGLRPTVIGKGDVDHAKCLQHIKNAGFDGFVALEYEGEEDETTGVPASVKFMKSVMKNY
ncbi:sugar phosphate isomerase/epimerase [bacterium]|nr:sugar phosphate isomerase/epimerase [bacterium]